MKPAEVRFYCDADILGLGKLLARLRADVTYPGDLGAAVRKRLRPACPVTSPATADPVWIPEVARRGWVVITRDNRINRRPAEVAAVRDHAACLVALAGPDARTTWDQLEIVMTQWRQIEALHGLPGPFIYTATRSSLRKFL